MTNQSGGCAAARLRYLFSFLSGCLFIAFSCRQPAAPPETAYTGKDLFADKAQVKYASGFDIGYHPNYKVVSVFVHSGNRADTIQYVLVQRGTPAPGNYPHAQKITIPLQTMIGTSSMHVALADFAECTEVLAGLENLHYVYAAAVRERIAAGKIKQVGEEGNLNNELIVTMHPDLVMATQNPEAASGKYQALTGAGIPVLLNAEYRETTPLGQAEWVKLMAALVNKEALVNTKFAEVENKYRALASLGSKAADKPSVITGLAYKGAWFVPGGESFVAQFLKDAGAAYKWAGVKGTGNLALNFEAVAPEALSADYWLNTGDAVSRPDLTARDNRYADFKPFKSGHIYNNNNRISDQGSNDYWESAAVNPQLVLADLISIFHPALLAGHELVYYKQLK